MNILSYNLIF